MATHVDLHVLHAFPLSNLNRDDLGSPKTAMYGGAERSRVSSQSTKRGVRHRVEDVLGDKALRTRRVPEAVATELTRRGWETPEAKQAGEAVALAAGVQGLAIADGGTTTVMLYLPASGISALADLVEKNREAIEAAAKQAAAEAGEKGKAKKPVLDAATKAAIKSVNAQVREILASRNGSIAAFGRMLANTPEVTVDGAISVAHAITTHATAEQPDFFTAVDDIPGTDNGSAHMGTAAHTSGTFYRYASVNVSELTRNLEGDQEAAVTLLRAFLAEFAVNVPTAKSRSTAPYTPPALVHYTVRTDQPVSLAGAFEAPVSAYNGSGWTAPSIAALDQHAGAVTAFFGNRHLRAAAHTGTATSLESVTHLGEHIAPLDDLVDRITAAALAQENNQ